MPGSRDSTCRRFRAASLASSVTGLAAIERLPEPKCDEFAVPDLAVGIYDWVVSFDHRQRRAWIIARGEDAESTIATISTALRRPTELTNWPRSEAVAIRSPDRPLANRPSVSSNFSRDEYEAAASRAIEHIRAGDVFQVNLSQCLLTPLVEHPLDLYGQLRACNPVPF